ncbi:unnamed protein product, partial [Ceratitis capitata]
FPAKATNVTAYVAAQVCNCTRHVARVIPGVCKQQKRFVTLNEIFQSNACAPVQPCRARYESELLTVTKRDEGNKCFACIVSEVAV